MWQAEPASSVTLLRDGCKKAVAPLHFATLGSDMRCDWLQASPPPWSPILKLATARKVLRRSSTRQCPPLRRRSLAGTLLLLLLLARSLAENLCCLPPPIPKRPAAWDRLTATTTLSVGCESEKKGKPSDSFPGATPRPASHQSSSVRLAE